MSEPNHLYINQSSKCKILDIYLLIRYWISTHQSDIGYLHTSRTPAAGPLSPAWTVLCIPYWAASCKNTYSLIKDIAAAVAQSVGAFVQHAEGWCSNPSRDRPKSLKRALRAPLLNAQWRHDHYKWMTRVTVVEHLHMSETFSSVTKNPRQIKNI